MYRQLNVHTAQAHLHITAQPKRPVHQLVVNVPTNPSHAPPTPPTPLHLRRPPPPWRPPPSRVSPAAPPPPPPRRRRPSGASSRPPPPPPPRHPPRRRPRARPPPRPWARIGCGGTTAGSGSSCRWDSGCPRWPWTRTSPLRPCSPARSPSTTAPPSGAAPSCGGISTRSRSASAPTSRSDASSMPHGRRPQVTLISRNARSGC